MAQETQPQTFYRLIISLQQIPVVYVCLLSIKQKQLLKFSAFHPIREIWFLPGHLGRNYSQWEDFDGLLHYSELEIHKNQNYWRKPCSNLRSPPLLRVLYAISDSLSLNS